MRYCIVLPGHMGVLIVIEFSRLSINPTTGPKINN